MWTKGRIITSIILGMFLGLLAFWIVDRSSSTPPSRQPHEPEKPRTHSPPIQPEDRRPTSKNSGPAKVTGAPVTRPIGTSPAGPKAPSQEGKKQPSDFSKRAAEPASADTGPKGRLSVYVEPWGRISVDGEPAVDTPIELVLSAGSHKVIVEYEGHKITRKVTIEAGRTAHLVYP